MRKDISNKGTNHLRRVGTASECWSSSAGYRSGWPRANPTLDPSRLPHSPYYFLHTSGAVLCGAVHVTSLAMEFPLHNIDLFIWDLGDEVTR